MLKWMKIHPNGVLHAPQRYKDAGFDLVPMRDEYIFPNNVVAVRTGIAVAIPEGFFGLIKERSSLAAKGLVITGGVIDWTYTGELIVISSYHQPNDFSSISLNLKEGERFAQLLIIRQMDLPILMEMKELEETERGTKGFGSTGS